MIPWPLAWTALKGVLGNWRFWAILAVAASYLWTYHAGWSSAHDEHIAYVQRSQAVAAAKITETRAMIKEKDDEYAKNIGLVASSWFEFHNSKLRDDARAAERAKSAPVTSKVCGDAARDEGLSRAIQAHLDGTRAAVAEARRQLEGLFEQCQKQTESLMNLQDTVLRLKLINTPSGL